VTLDEALRDENIFASHFSGPTWEPWKALARVWEAQPLSAEDLALYQRHTGRTAPPSAPAREATLICGRRAGKSRILALIAVYLSAFKDYAPHLAAGEVATVALIAADRKQAKTLLRYISGLLSAVPMLAELVEDELQETIKLRNRVEITVQTASWRATRGYSYAAILADELAFWRDETSANPADEILRAVRPGLASIPGSCLLKASSPYGRRGPLFNDYRRYFGKADGRVLVWKAGSRAMNPNLDPAEVAAAEEEDPQAAQAEWHAEFRDDLSDYISREVVDACVVQGRVELPPVSGQRYSAFCDPAGGGGGDAMTLAIGHREGDRAVIDLVKEIRPPFSPDAAVQDFAETLRQYGIRRVEDDRYAGLWPAERFKAYGIDYEPAARPKSDLYRDTMPLLTSGRLELPDLPRLIAQLCGLERRTARGGRDSIDHGPGAHDDVANAVAGVAQMLNVRTGRYDLMRMMGMGSDYDRPGGGMMSRRGLEDAVKRAARRRGWRLERSRLPWGFGEQTAADGRTVTVRYHLIDGYGKLVAQAAAEELSALWEQLRRG
jgi:hypothetical protein